MKKSEIRLIMCGIGALVISVILTIITIVVFVTNVTMSANTEKIQNGFESIRSTVEDVTEDLTGS